MKAISLHQPWASLLVTRQPCPDPLCEDGEYKDDSLTILGVHGGRVGYALCSTCKGVPPMVKRFETRSWPCPPALIGQPIAIHATKQIPADQLEVGKYACWNTTDGCSMLAETIGRDGYTGQPIADYVGEWLPLGAVVGSGRITASYPIVDTLAYDGSEVVWRNTETTMLRCGPSLPPGIDAHSISDQLPYGDFTPGRYAWLIEDAAPTTERCPWCWGAGEVDAPMCGDPDCCCTRRDCPVCKGAGRCDPIPARGHQRIWSWQP